MIKLNTRANKPAVDYVHQSPGVILTVSCSV